MIMIDLPFSDIKIQTVPLKFLLNQPKQTFQDYNTCTSGFVILGGSEVRTSSVVLDIDDADEDAIRKKFSPLVIFTTIIDQ